MGQSITKCLNLYVATGSGFAWNLFITFLLYALWGVGTFAILEFFMEDSDVEAFNGGISFMVGVTAIAVYKWISDAYVGYTDRETSLRSVLRGCSMAFTRISQYSKGAMLEHSGVQDIDGNNIYSMESFQDSNSSNIRRQNYRGQHSYSGNKSTGTTEQLVKQLEAKITIVKRIISTLAFYSFRLYIDHDQEHCQSGKKLLTELGYHEELSRSKDIENGNITISMMDSPKRRVSFLSNQLAIQLSTLHKSGLFSDAQFREINEKLNPLYDVWEAPTLETEQRGLEFSRTWLKIVVFSQFLLVVPFEMFLRIRFLMVFFYPVIMSAFTGLYIARQWVGDLLDKNNPFGTLRYFNWRWNILADIDREYDSVLALSAKLGVESAKSNITSSN